MALIEFTLYSFDKTLWNKVDEIILFLNKWCLSIKQWSIISQNNREFNDENEKGTSKPNFREPALQIQCLGEFMSLPGFCDYHHYQRIIESYINKSSLVTTKFQLPWLALYTNRAFPNVRAASHENVLLDNIQLGTLVNPNTFYHHFEIATISDFNNAFQISANFFHDTKELEVLINSYAKFVLSYSNIRRIIVSVENRIFLYLCLINPPLLYTSNGNNYRKVSFKRAVHLDKEIMCGEGSCYVCRTELTMDVLGRSNMILLTFCDFETAQQVISRMFFRCGKFPICYTNMINSFEPAPCGIPNFDLGHFGCTYMCSSLLRKNFIIQMQNLNGKLDGFLYLLKEMADISPECLYDTLVDLHHKMDEGSVIHYRSAISDIFKWKSEQALCLKELCAQDFNVLSPPKTRKVWRIVITPTRFILYPADVCFENRVIRNFNPSYACRVSFRDDTMRKICLAQIHCDGGFIDHTIRIPLLEGIPIGPRHFEFLGWSNSQLRDHAVWTYAVDPEGNSAASIRTWMGNFSNIHSVPKFMARMGQCFSQTEAAVKVPLNPKHIRTEPDIMGGINPESGSPYCFSDGIGRISEKVRQDVCQALELESCPSAFQIRYAGYKGMLVVDPNLKDVDIVFRESMNKFPCIESYFLEIAKTSSAVQVLLNRQLITILDQKGVPCEVFLKLQQDMLTMLTEMLLDSTKAADWLSVHSSITHVNFHKLSEAGIILNIEPFFRAMLLAQHRVSVEGLRTKARLYIEPSLGRNMFGVIDETGTLEYGQVYVQYTTNIQGKRTNLETTVLKGKVLITKNPCLQLGDVRLLEAIDVPALSHIVDCIVFPQKGPRPHPNEMAGSDLDGDEYTVIWMKELFFEENSRASTFPIPNIEFESRDIKVPDMIDFLCKYVSNDQVGHIANCHLAQADNMKYGLKHDICTAIAKKFSLAVDFAKNGQVVNLSTYERPTMYPDFMEKGRHGNTYRSRRTLGKLYRVCLDFEEENQISNMNYSEVKVDQSFIYPGWEKFREEAEVIRNNYNSALGLLLSTYGVQHEAEAAAKAFSKVHSRLQERQDRADVEDLITHSIKNLWNNMKKEFFGNVDPAISVSVNNYSEEHLQKASAWYIVTYIKPRPQFISFPWIVWNILINIKQINDKKLPDLPHSVRNPFVTQLDKAIQNRLQQTKVAELSNEINQICVRQKTFPREHLQLALKIALHWGRHHKIVQNGLSDISRKLHPIKFVQFFLGIITKNCSQNVLPIEMLLEFFKFCIAFRFLNKQSLREIAPSFTLKNYKYIGKKCMYTFHSLAIGSNFDTLGLLAPNNLMEDHEIEMEPIRVPKKLAIQHSRSNYEILKRMLIDYTGVSDVHIRPKQDFLLISGTGSPGSVRLHSVIKTKTVDP